MSFAKPGEGNTEMTINLLPDDYSINTYTDENDQIDLFNSYNAGTSEKTALSQYFSESGGVRDDYAINMLNSGTGRFMDLTAVDTGKYEYSGNGLCDYRVTSKRTGIVYYVSVRKRMPSEVFDAGNPDIVYVRGYSLQDSTYGMTAAETKECGVFTLVADDTEKFISQLELIIRLNPSATCSISKESIFARNPIASADVTNTGNTFTVSLTAGEDGFGDNLWIPFTVNDKSYGLCFVLIENDDVTLTCNFNNLYKNTLPNVPSSVIDLYDYMNFGERQAEFEASINAGDEGRYSLIADGLEPLFENGVFKGKAVFYHPFERVAIYDKEKNKEACGVNTNFQARLRTAVKAGTTLDLRTLIGGYWNMSATTLSESDKWIGPNAKDLANFGGRSDSPDTARSLYLTTVSHDSDTVTKLSTPYIFEAPEVTEITTYTLKVLTLTRSRYNSAENPNNDVAALFYVTVYPDGQFKEAVGDIIDGLPAEGDEVADDKLDSLLEKNGITGIKAGFGDNGTLPGPAEIKIFFTTEEVRQFGDTDYIQVYYVNSNGTGMNKEAEKCYLVKDPGRDGYYYITITLTHNSNFVLTSATRSSYSSGGYMPSGGNGSGTGSGTGVPAGTGNAGGTEEKSEEKSEEQADEKPEEKPEEKAEEKADEKADVKDDKKTENKVTEGSVKTNKNGDRVLVDEDGRKIKKSVVAVGNDLYFADKNGKVVTSKVVKDADGNRYFATKSGKLAKNKVVTAGDGSRYFATKSGKLAKNKVVTAKDGKKYYAGKNGKLVCSKWVKVGKKEYYCNKNGRITKTRKVK